MNEKKIQQLLQAAQKEAPPEVPLAFSRSVLSAVTRLPSRIEVSFADQLGRLFPRIAFASLVIIALCAGFDRYVADEEVSLTATVEQVAADEWLFAGK